MRDLLVGEGLRSSGLWLRDGLVHRQRLVHFYACDNAVPQLRQRFYVPRLACGVIQDAAEFLDPRVEAVLEIHECFFGPEEVAQLFSRHNVPRALDEYPSDLKGLRAQLQFDALFIEFPRPTP